MRRTTRRIVFVLVAVVSLTGVVAYMDHASGLADGQAAPIFGVKMPAGYRDWKLISVAHEEGTLNDLRAILGNDVAIKASREGSFRSRTAPSLPDSPGVMTRWRKAKKPLAVSNLSWPGHPRTGFSSWSRTQENTPRPAAGASLNSTTANPLTKPCTRLAFPAMRPSRLATLSSTVTHLKTESHRTPPAYDHREREHGESDI